MEQNRQCPRCGKYVAADRTYCMSCGVTLGVKCPDCRAVMPVGAKACTGCGHSFVEKKKLAFKFPLWDFMKKRAGFILSGAVLLLLLFTLLMALFPAVDLTVVAEGKPDEVHSLTGYDLMGYFLGFHSRGTEAFLEIRELEKALPGMQALLFGMGLGWLTTVFGLIFGVILLAPNLFRVGKATARRFYLPFGISLGGALLSCGLTIPLLTLLRDTFTRYTSLAEDSYQLFTTVIAPFFVPFAALGVLALHILLHIAVFRSTEPAREEWSIAHTLWIPVKGAAMAVRLLLDYVAEKRGDKPRKRGEAPFIVTSRFTYYLILLGVALVFTQALLSKVSNLFFWFVLLLPFILLGYVFLAGKALTVRMESETATTEKNTPYTYSFRIGNRLPLAIPFLEACVSIPQSNSVRCTERTVCLSMAPLSGYTMTNTVPFRYRGTYDIGVKYIYVYDFFRMFRYRVDMEEYSTVYVLPRRMNLSDTQSHSVSDDTARTVKSPLVVDRLEISDIREYQNGDPLKSIHWKLSSKSETFIVKDYNTGTSNQTVIFCDLTPHYPDEPPKASEEGDEKGAEKKLSKKERKAKKKAEKAQKKADKADKNKKKKKNKNKKAKDEAVLPADVAEVAVETETPIRPAESARPSVDVHELASPLYYEDMNEYLADGVVEITIASVLAELRRGHEVLLVWYDRRSDAGVFAYPIRDAEQFERIYHLFATAPLCEPNKKVTTLTAMVNEIQSTKQMFMLSALDAAMLTDLTTLPGISDAESFGAAEVLLYDPSVRFRYPKERALYLNGCREQLATSGMSLSAGTFHLNSSEGGIPNERS